MTIGNFTQVDAVILAVLKAGMTTGHSSSDDFYVKTWYTEDPIALPATELPTGVVVLEDGERQTVFVGEDAPIFLLKIRLFQPAFRKAGSAAEIAAGRARLQAMVQQATVLLRTDPTFTSQFMYSEIIGLPFYKPGVAGYNNSRQAEISLKVVSRALWGS